MKSLCGLMVCRCGSGPSSICIFFFNPFLIFFYGPAGENSVSDQWNQFSQVPKQITRMKQFFAVKKKHTVQPVMIPE